MIHFFLKFFIDFVLKDAGWYTLLQLLLLLSYFFQNDSRMRFTCQFFALISIQYTLLWEIVEI